jgi:hypothetical protein
LSRRAFALVLVVSALLSSGASRADRFHDGTAATLPPGRATVGLFEPARLGLLPGLELSSHLLADALIPNVGLRYARARDARWSGAVDVGLHTPTPALALVARDGVGGLLPPNVEAPPLVAIDFGTALSVRLATPLSWTGRVRARLVPGADPALPLIELPFVLQRTAAYSSGFGASLLSRLSGPLPAAFAWRLDVEAFFHPQRGARWAVEPAASLSWTPLDAVRLTAGARWLLAEVPWGVYSAAVWPFADLEVGFDLWRPDA